jgi:signal peptidase II
MKKSANMLTAAVCAFVAFALDQASKYIILENPGLSGLNHIEISPFFNLVLVMNRGVSFGMFAGHNQPLIIIIISLMILAALIVWLWRNTVLAVSIGIGMIIGGAAGNICDRIRFGAVVDFLDFHVAGLHWPAFNIADSFVFIGVVVLLIYSMFFEKKNQTGE